MIKDKNKKVLLINPLNRTFNGIIQVGTLYENAPLGLLIIVDFR